MYITFIYYATHAMLRYDNNNKYVTTTAKTMYTSYTLADNSFANTYYNIYYI